MKTLKQLTKRMLKGIDNDALYLRFLVLHRNKHWLNLRHPKTFNDKLQWLKLYYRDSRLKPLVNKYECREYVAAQIGAHHLPNLLTVYQTPQDIDWNALPNQFVMKVPHGSGFNIICPDKSRLDISLAIEKLNYWQSSESPDFLHSKQWTHGGGQRCILVEEFLSTPNGAIPDDFKFFCFGGKPKFIQVDVDRFTGHRRNLYDLDWHILPVCYGYLNADKDISPPARLHDMIEIAQNLSQGLPFARIDLYALEARIVFGEITLFPEGGLRPFKPGKYDRIFGDMLDLPEQKILSI